MKRAKRTLRVKERKDAVEIKIIERKETKDDKIIDIIYKRIRNNPNIFCYAIKMFRKIKGYTQKDIAEMINVDNTTVSKWERGISFPKRETFKKMIKQL